MKTVKERAAAAKILEHIIDEIHAGKVNWIAISTKYHSGALIAVHTKGAPKRPKGMS